MATKSKIYIKPSKRGSLRKAMGAKSGQKLSVSAMRSRLKNASPAMRKKLQFALNARKWKHELGGYLPEFQEGGINIPGGMNPLFPNVGMNLSAQGLAPMNTTPTGGGMGLQGLSSGMFSGIAGIGSGLIDAFARPDETGEDFRSVDINEGARAGKGALKGAATGAAAGSIIPGIGTLIGAGVGAIGGALSGWFGGKKEEKEANTAMNKRLNAYQSASRLATMKQSPTYMPVARQGGYIAYKGETHDGPSGGILVDEQGNPTGQKSFKSAVALVEGAGKNKNKIGEVSKYDPNTSSTYIYSDSLGFAKPANSLLHKYELDKPDSLKYLQYKNDILTKEAVDRQFDNLTTAQEFAKGTDTSSEESMGMFKKGGRLTAAKAGEMLKDGTAHGKKLTAKQKRYFGWVRGGRKEEGGLLPTYQGLPGETSILPEEPYNYLDARRSNMLSEQMANNELLKIRRAGKYRNLNAPDIGFGALSYGMSEAQYYPGVMHTPSTELIGFGTGNVPIYSKNNNGEPILEIPAGKPIIRKPEDAPKRTTGTGVGIPRSAPGVGIPTTEPVINTKSRFGNSRGFNFGQGLAKMQSPTTPGTTEEGSFTPWLNPAGHILSAAGNIADWAAMRKAKPTDVRLPRVGAERIDLSRQRLINERNAAAARATNVANTRKLGVNAGATFSNLAASNTGVNRLLGEENMQSLMQQETANTQMQQQANLENARLGAEETMMNTQQLNAYRAAMARMNPLGNVARTAASYMKDNSAYQQGYDTLQMMSPDAYLYRKPDSSIFGRPGVKVTDRNLFSAEEWLKMMGNNSKKQA